MGFGKFIKKAKIKRARSKQRKSVRQGKPDPTGERTTPTSRSKLKSKQKAKEQLHRILGKIVQRYTFSNTEKYYQRVKRIAKYIDSAYLRVK